MNNDSYQDPNAMAKIDGAKVRRLRESKGLTQLYLATFVGVTTDTVSRWENKRYQTIKQANALKLAEALEVTLEDILDRTGRPASDSKSDSGPADYSGRNGRLRSGMDQGLFLRLGIAVGFLALIAGAIFYFLQNRKPPLLSPASADGIRITAERYVPNHCAPNQLFPVAIRIHTNSMQPVSLIVKEEVPEGLTLGASQPPFTATDNQGRIVRWLLKAGQRETKLFYLCKTPAAATAGQKFFFSGSVTVKGQKPVTITSWNSLEIAPYHWADSNRDYKISDEEILSAYDYYSEASELGINFDRIEEIWSAGGYKWDSAKQTFTVVQ